MPTKASQKPLTNAEKAEKAEKEAKRLVAKAAKAVPSGFPEGVTLGWDWDTKTFDVFLSHKITDAKDVVLTWYNALSALGYNPFTIVCSCRGERHAKIISKTCSAEIAQTADLVRKEQIH